METPGHITLEPGWNFHNEPPSVPKGSSTAKLREQRAATVATRVEQIGARLRRGQQ